MRMLPRCWRGSDRHLKVGHFSGEKPHASGNQPTLTSLRCFCALQHNAALCYTLPQQVALIIKAKPWSV